MDPNAGAERDERDDTPWLLLLERANLLDERLLHALEACGATPADAAARLARCAHRARHVHAEDDHWSGRQLRGGRGRRRGAQKVVRHRRGTRHDPRHRVDHGEGGRVGAQLPARRGGSGGGDELTDLKQHTVRVGLWLSQRHLIALRLGRGCRTSPLGLCGGGCHWLSGQCRHRRRRRGHRPCSCTRNRLRVAHVPSLCALGVHQRRPVLRILGARDTIYRLVRRERADGRAPDPRRVFALGRRDDLDPHRRGREGVKVRGEALGEARQERAAAREHDVAPQVGANVDVAPLDGGEDELRRIERQPTEAQRRASGSANVAGAGGVPRRCRLTPTRRDLARRGALHSGSARCRW